MCVCVWERESVCVWEREKVCECVYGVCVWERERGWLLDTLNLFWRLTKIGFRNSCVGLVMLSAYSSRMRSSKLKDYKTRKQSAHWHLIRMTKKCSLSYNFILLTSTEGNKPVIVCCAVRLRKSKPAFLLCQLIQTFCEWQIRWAFPHFHITALSFMSDTCWLSLKHQVTYLLTCTHGSVHF